MSTGRYIIALRTRALIVALIAVGALLVPSGRGWAAGKVGPPPVSGPQHGDYYIYAETCTGSDAAYTCAFYYAQMNAPGAAGTPTIGYFGCQTGGTNLPYREGYVIFGYPSYQGTGHVTGMAGVLPSTGSRVVAFSSLFGSSNTNYYGFQSPSSSGSVWGTASGTVAIDNSTSAVTGGVILIHISGTIVNYSNDTTSQGSMSCAITPSAYSNSDSYASATGSGD